MCECLVMRPNTLRATVVLTLAAIVASSPKFGEQHPLNAPLVADAAAARAPLQVLRCRVVFLTGEHGANAGVAGQ